MLQKIVDLYRQAGAFVEDLFLRQRLRTANVGLDRYVHLTWTISNYCTAGDSLDVCDKPDGGMIPLALHVPQRESRCKTVHSPPAASPSSLIEDWAGGAVEGPNRVGKDDGLLKPFGISTSSEEEEDISEGGKQGTPTISVTKTIIYSTAHAILYYFLRFRTK